MESLINTSLTPAAWRVSRRGECCSETTANSRNPAGGQGRGSERRVFWPALNKGSQQRAEGTEQRGQSRKDTAGTVHSPGKALRQDRVWLREEVEA